MIVEDQSATIAFLSDPSSYGEGVASVERIDTHISHLFLAGERAYKLKRAVKFSYLDFSSAALRLPNCSRMRERNGSSRSLTCGAAYSSAPSAVRSRPRR